MPFFAIGGIDPHNVAQIHAAGGRRVAVVRALTQADDPAAVANRLKQALADPDQQEVYVGAT
jgi:thiamine-phosphate pyrophosphorylase